MGNGLPIFLGAGAAGFAAAAVLSWIALGREGAPLGSRLLAAGVFLFFAVVSFFAMEHLRRVRVTIDDLGIEYVEWRASRRLRLEQLAGYRTVEGKGMAYLLLELRQPGAKRVKIPLAKTMAGPEFAAWLSRLTDLDARDRARSEAEVLASPALGGTPEVRAASLSGARRIANALNAAGMLVGFWALLFPRPYGLVVAAAYAIPVVTLAVAAFGRGQYQLLGKKTDARPQLVLALLMPGICATLRAFDWELLDPYALLVPAVVAGIVASGLALAADPAIRRKPAWLLLFVPFLAGQAAGAITVGNCYRDPSPPVVHRAEVVGHHVSRGKTVTHYLTLAPWGPRTHPDDVKVSSLVYAEVEDGQTVGIEVRSGRLGFPWFRVVPDGPVSSVTRPR
jgi:hypothetical protein